MKVYIIIVLFSIFAVPAVALALDSDQETYLNSLVQGAIHQDLAHERYWLLLVHYKKTIFGGYKSQEDGLAFFNSPHGKTDPEAELSATLRKFFISPEDLKPGEEHPQCDFPARYKWLKSRLNFDPARLPERKCGRLEAWKKDLNPEKITLVFASFYMNNPASMFGHTLLRLDKKREGPNQKLLDYGVNYAAQADTFNIFIYSFKGVFGGFKGNFAIFPYYVKIQEYNNLENRDLWEYELNFTEDQLDYFMLHLWELGGNYFDYYYFQENCSYHILSLLEVANPDLHLTDQFNFQVIPADTIKAVTQQPGLVAKRVYRPSLLSQMNQKRMQMTGREKTFFKNLVRDTSFIQTEEYRTLSSSEKALILDTYLDYAQFQDMKKERTPGFISKGTREILLERSRLDFRRDSLSDKAEFSTPPELGHGSARVELGFGRNQSEFFQEISLRPAYQDLLANDLGYGKYSQLEFFEINARYYDDFKKLKLESFKLFDAVSLTPFDSLFHKISWKLRVGVDTIRDLNCHYCNSLKTDFGLGLSHKPPFFSPVLFYLFGDLEGEASSAIAPWGRLGGGGTGGILLDLTDDLRFQAAGEYRTFPIGRESHYYKVYLAQRYSISRNFDVRGRWNLINGRQEWSAGINCYF